MEVREIRIRSILTRTGGFLREGFSHTVNPYSGCAYGGALCGGPCYAQHNTWVRQGRPWGTFLDVKVNAAEAFREQAERERRWAARRGGFRIYMSSVTDPYVPQERRYGITRALLGAMLDSPPDRLNVQTHTPYPLRDLDLLRALRERVPDLCVNISVETDRESLGPGFPPHATPIAGRIAALAALRGAGIPCVAVVAPMLPIERPAEFARRLGEAADAVVLDHFLIGDGSPGGLRTRHTGFPLQLEASGWPEWSALERFNEVCDIFRKELGPDRVGVSCSGFNAPGPGATAAAPAAPRSR
jgi:DNA repair photolyase